MTIALLLACVAAAIAAAVLIALRGHRLRRRAVLFGDILDLADRLERELLECRARLREVPALARSAESGAVSARATLAAEPQVQDALRDLLAHRLWLKEHGGTATIEELGAARDALASTQATLRRQMDRLAEVRAELASRLAPQGST